jgi:hypothetical protein
LWIAQRFWVLRFRLMVKREHQKEKRSMDHAGLDVSVKETSVCIVDDTGKIIREVKNSDRTRCHGPAKLSDARDRLKCINGFFAKSPRRRPEG